MITVLTALHDLVHSGQFSAQRHRERKKIKKGEKERRERREELGEGRKMKARKTNRLTKTR